MPYCHAPIQDVDHVTRARDGGATTADNGQGLCRACNLDKETEGLRTEVVRAADGTRAVRVRTRYGQTHHSQPPPVLDTLDDLGARWHGEQPPWWSGRDRGDEEDLLEAWNRFAEQWDQDTESWDTFTEEWDQLAEELDDDDGQGMDVPA